jgi:opacity protein-like surface antigen
MSDVWWFDAGYFFTPYIGVDAAFMHLGEMRYIAVGSISGSANTESLASTTEVTSHGPALSLILRLPLTESFDVSLRVGDYFGKTLLQNDVIAGGNSVFFSQSKSGSSLLAGVGASYAFAGHYSVRIDYLRVNDSGDSGTTGKFSINMATVGVSYTF